MQSGFLDEVELMRETPNAIGDVSSGGIGTPRVVNPTLQPVTLGAPSAKDPIGMSLREGHSGERTYKNKSQRGSLRDSSKSGMASM